MADYRNRYPGAQPFTDDYFSRKVFFGRDGAARALADKILANHVVTVYARSGLGKTSLLQAGVAPRLRERGYLPLFVRVNDVRIGLLHALLETVPGEAARQQVEYVPGRSESLWSFFKTAEFWREDLLLTPVLILDQFEELFTLQSEDARTHFLNELSYLIRGVRPPAGDETPPGEELSEHPPAVRIVLSLCEDYLGSLEEAAEHIPHILDARFRLSPLDLHAATEAIVGPAAVTDPDLETRPFALEPTAVTAILDCLSQARTRIVGETRRYVEPFQLQLICRRVEQIADARQEVSHADLIITMVDLGGQAGLTQSLRDFYQEAIESLPDRRNRRASQRLCQEYLISPEGRRLSLEEIELRRLLGLPRETLGRLVASRLLRSDNRAESTYYELSHDALVEPILAYSTKALPAVLIAVAALTGAIPPIVALSTDYVYPGEYWYWQTASWILIGISFCVLAWMARHLRNKFITVSGWFMAPIVVLSTISQVILISAVYYPDFLRIFGYPTLLGLPSLVGFLFGVAVYASERVAWAAVMAVWGLFGLVEAMLTYSARTAPFAGRVPNVARIADTALIIQNLILLTAAILIYTDRRSFAQRTSAGRPIRK